MRDSDRSFGAVTVLVGEKNGKYPDGNSLLVRGRDAALLIDPSLSVAARAAELAAVDLVVQSHVHEDHVAGLFALSASAAVHAHRRGRRRPAQPRRADGDLRLVRVAACAARVGGDAVQLRAAPGRAGHTTDGARLRARRRDACSAIHLPGHTRGHCALLAEPDGVLFLGDIDLSGFGPYYGDAWSCLEDFERSLARVREHAGPGLGDVPPRRRDRGARRIPRQARPLRRPHRRTRAAHCSSFSPSRARSTRWSRTASSTRRTRSSPGSTRAERRTIEQHLARMTATGASNRSTTIAGGGSVEAIARVESRFRPCGGRPGWRGR